MSASEDFTPFWENLTFHRVKYDYSVELIEKIIPVGYGHYLAIDRLRNYHLLIYEEDSFLPKYPIPPYAETKNPRVVYSVDYDKLYSFIYQKKMSQKCYDNYLSHIDSKEKYVFHVLIGEDLLAVQFNKYDPLVLIRLRDNNNHIEILPSISGVKHLVKVSPWSFAYYSRRHNRTFLYNWRVNKMKKLNFSALHVKDLLAVKDDIIVAVFRGYIEMLNYKTNKIIRSFTFTDNREIPFVAAHYDSNMISFISGDYIYVFEIENGHIKWENKYEYLEHSEDPFEYKFLSQTHIIAEIKSSLYIFLLTPHRFNLLTVLQQPWIGNGSPSGSYYKCCSRATRKSFQIFIEILNDNYFFVAESYCKGKQVYHGLQTVTLFKFTAKGGVPKNLTPFKFIPLNVNAYLGDFEFSAALIFEEYRDPVCAMDVVVEENLGVFITEKGKIYCFNLKTWKVTYCSEIIDITYSPTGGTRYIDKIYIMKSKALMIVIRISGSPYLRIIVFSLKDKCIEWDTENLDELTDQGIELSFYDVTKLENKTIIATYNERQNQRTSYYVGEIILGPPRDEISIYKYSGINVILETNNTETQIYDKIWSLQGPVVALRHVQDVFKISFYDYDFQIITGELAISRFHNVINVHIWGIQDVKPISRDVICVQVKLTTEDYILMFYNFENQTLLKEIRTEFELISKVGDSLLLGFYGLADFGMKIISYREALEEDKYKELTLFTGDLGFLMRANTFKAIKKDQLYLGYEGDHNKNFVCLFRLKNYRVECLRVVKRALESHYHNYLFKSVIDFIFQ